MSRGFWIASSLALVACLPAPDKASEREVAPFPAPVSSVLEQKMEDSAERIKQTSKGVDAVQEDLDAIKRKLKAQKKQGKGVFAEHD